MERLVKHQSVSGLSAHGIVLCLRGVAHWHTAVEHHTGTPHSSVCRFADGPSNYQHDRIWTVSSQLRQKNKRNFETGCVLLIVDFLSLLSHALSTYWTCSHPASCLQTSVGRRAASTAVRPYSRKPSFTHWTDCTSTSAGPFFLDSYLWLFVKHTANKRSSSSLPGMQLFSCQYPSRPLLKLANCERKNVWRFLTQSKAVRIVTLITS